ncbi:MAG: histidine phosphatase family protein [Lachnospiraceae bacterium]|nr:histidine phosphatase family protein [Lachnospiraceae bacterium]MBQ9614133.1 histidine phosphatase family protein [Lachnospiraceae bacterium]
MKIWITRHGQTNLNKARLMQGLTDEPLNETGLEQARQTRALLEETHPGIVFDAVYASPLKRAIVTGSIIGNVPEDQIIRDERIIEADFGRYEKKCYWLVGPRMTLYWGFPEYFPAPSTVETTEQMIRRAHGFLRELEQKDYENVLVACHGGIIRALTGYLEDAPRGYIWRPRPHNCEVRIYESSGGKHRFLEKIQQT